jgi:AcrR family transcriptional regulator
MTKDRDSMTPPSDLRSRLAHAALDLFARKGFEVTTVDEIAAAVGVNRRTFFRYFPAKEDAVFFDFPELLGILKSDLDEGLGDPIPVAGHALSMQLDELLRRSDLVHRRDALTQTTPALAERELIWSGEYQRILGEHLGQNYRASRDQMYARIVAAALLAAFNQVVTAWIREGQDPKSLFAELTDDITESMTSSGVRGVGPGPGHPDTLDSSADRNAAVDQRVLERKSS